MLANGRVAASGTLSVEEHSSQQQRVARMNRAVELERGPDVPRPVKKRDARRVMVILSAAFLIAAAIL